MIETREHPKKKIEALGKKMAYVEMGEGRDQAGPYFENGRIAGRLRPARDAPSASAREFQQIVGSEI